MPSLVIEFGAAETLTVPVPDGGPLIDICDDTRCAVPFSCRGANCGTCRVDILEGGAELLPAEDEELDVLDLFGDDATKRRLACQAKMRPGMATLRIRAVPDDA